MILDYVIISAHLMWYWYCVISKLMMASSLCSCSTDIHFVCSVNEIIHFIVSNNIVNISYVCHFKVTLFTVWLYIFYYTEWLYLSQLYNQIKKMVTLYSETLYRIWFKDNKIVGVVPVYDTFFSLLERVIIEMIGL